MKLEEGMYARTLNGIVKIDKIQDNVMKDTKGNLHYGDFVKASYNIIDLIEEGDYVNGHKVSKVVIDSSCSYVLLEEVGSYVDNPDDINEEDIKTIVTKEQFESMSYKLED